MSTQIRTSNNTLRQHRPPGQWRRYGPKVNRAFSAMRGEVMQELPKPFWRRNESVNEIDLTRSQIIIREVLHVAMKAEIDDFTAAQAKRPGVSRLGFQEVSIFDRNDYRRAILSPGMTSAGMEEYLEDFVSGYPAGHMMRTFINRPVVVGASRRQSGSRYVALALEGEGAGQIMDERAFLRSGISGYNGQMYSIPHFSILETKDQECAEEICEELARTALSGSVVILGRPEIYNVQDVL